MREIILQILTNSEVNPGQDPAGLQVGLTRDNDKNNYYYSFKTRLESRPKISSGLCVGRVNQGQYKTKQVIIIVLKLDLENNLRQGSGYRLGGSTPLIQFFLNN